MNDILLRSVINDIYSITSNDKSSNGDTSDRRILKRGPIIPPTEVAGINQLLLCLPYCAVALP